MYMCVLEKRDLCNVPLLSHRGIWFSWTLDGIAKRLDGSCSDTQKLGGPCPRTEDVRDGVWVDFAVCLINQ